MKGALIILAVTVVAGIILYVCDRISRRRAARSGKAVEDDGRQPEQPSQECCGLHMVCERDSLLKAASAEVVYYDDYELDAYAGTPADGYTEAQIEEFRDILLTLRPDDIAGWARSLQLRGIALPSGVREELLLLVGEERQRRAGKQA